MKVCYLADSESIHTKRWCLHFLKIGYQVSLISFKNQCNIDSVDFHYVDVGGINVKGGNWKVLLNVGKVNKVLKKIKPDVLHAHYGTSYGVVGALTNFHPYIITTLGSDVLISPKNSVVYKLLLKYAFAKADWITTMAPHMAEAITEIGDFSDKTTVVPFGIDTDLFNAKERKLSTDKFVITSTRNFEDVYNIPHLLKAVAKAKNRIPSIELNLIGDGTKREEIKDEVKRLGLEDYTIFYGKVEQRKIVEILCKSHIFVSVSLSDGNNISLNEAMACGCFPIVTNIEANTQWIDEGLNGFLVEIDDVNRLSELIVQSYETYQSLSERAFEINQNIIEKRANWNLNMKSVEDKYKELKRGK